MLGAFLTRRVKNLPSPIPAAFSTGRSLGSCSTAPELPLSPRLAAPLSSDSTFGPTLEPAAGGPLTLGGQAVMVSAPDKVLHLAKYWNTTEFNVFGDGNGSEANFGLNTTLDAQTAIVGTSTKAPQCVAEGFTAETNNLSLTTTPALGKTKVPTMAAAQTNGTTTTASCATAG